jgi:hypothetical protein
VEILPQPRQHVFLGQTWTIVFFDLVDESLGQRNCTCDEESVLGIFLALAATSLFL